jgi:hypothetical protein
MVYTYKHLIAAIIEEVLGRFEQVFKLSISFLSFLI